MTLRVRFWTSLQCAFLNRAFSGLPAAVHMNGRFAAAGWTSTQKFRRRRLAPLDGVLTSTFAGTNLLIFRKASATRRPPTFHRHDLNETRVVRIRRYTALANMLTGASGVLQGLANMFTYEDKGTSVQGYPDRYADIMPARKSRLCERYC